MGKPDPRTGTIKVDAREARSRNNPMRRVVEVPIDHLKVTTQQNEQHHKPKKLFKKYFCLFMMFFIAFLMLFVFLFKLKNFPETGTVIQIAKGSDGLESSASNCGVGKGSLHVLVGVKVRSSFLPIKYHNYDLFVPADNLEIKDKTVKVRNSTTQQSITK